MTLDARRQVILSADVVACTLSTAGGDLARALAGLEGFPGFDALVVDEAGQAVELAALVPMPLLSKRARVVLVGDPQQLPATVLSRHALASNLAQSLVRNGRCLPRRLCWMPQCQAAQRKSEMGSFNARIPPLVTRDDRRNNRGRPGP